MFKLIKIKAYQVGLAFRNGKLVHVLQEGKHWFNWHYEVRVFDTTKPFLPGTDLAILLKNSDLAAMLEYVEVGDNELVLKFSRNALTEILPTGQYAYWKGVVDMKFIKIDLSSVDPPTLPSSILDHRMVGNYLRKFSVESYQAGILSINNKIVSILPAGTYYYWRNATTITVSLVDQRVQQMEVAGQELLTKDKANIRLNFFGRYKVEAVLKAVVEYKEYEKQLYVLFQLALREKIATFTLDDLLAKKDTLGVEIIQEIQERASQLGLTLIDGGIRDIILPGDVKEIMNQVLVAEKKAQANIIMRREETASTRSLLNTANLMKDNEMLWKLKEMEYVEKIADKIGEISISGSGNVVAQLKEIFTK